MIKPATFKTDGDGKIEVFLGKRLVGAVSYSRDVSADAYHRMLLPINGAIGSPRPYSNIAAAKRALLSRLADWHEETHPELYAGMITALREQAEEVGR